MKSILRIALIALLFSSCYDDSVDKPLGPDGLRPIYSTIGSDLYQEPISFDDLNHVLVYKDLILALEENIGIHVIDNADPEQPTNFKFIPIYGVKDAVISEDILIVNAGRTFFSIDISDPEKAIFKSISFTEEMTNNPTTLYPNDYIGLFECVDLNKGFVLSWEFVAMTDSDCWR